MNKLNEINSFLWASRSLAEEVMLSRLAGEPVFWPMSAAAFCKTKDEFGAFSNMHDTHVYLGGTLIPSAEHLYQLGRFPHLSDRQEEILSQTEPAAAKAKTVRNKGVDTVPEFNSSKVLIMMRVVRLKYSQNRETFVALFEKIGKDRPIVEISKGDPFWGAEPDGDGFTGINYLGQIWNQIKDEYFESQKELSPETEQTT